MGALIGMYAVGFSINQLTLFAMVLAIGIVVDDAIVVVEAVERIMREEHLRAEGSDAQGDAPDHRRDHRHHRRCSRRCSSRAPCRPAASGVIYRQFALTIALSMGFSAFLALSLHAGAVRTLLRPEHLRGNFIFNWFNRAYERTLAAYVRRVYAVGARTCRAGWPASP